MSVYPVHKLEKNWTDTLNKLSDPKYHVETVEGLCLLLAGDLYTFMDCCHQELTKDQHEELVHWLGQGTYIKGKSQLICEYLELLGMETEDLWKKIGNHFYDVDKFHKAYEIYEKMMKANPENDYALANMGLIHIHYGQLDKGLNLLEQAYTIRGNESIYLQALKVKAIFDVLEDEEDIHQAAQAIHEFNDDTLGYLIWYYDRIGKEEASATSYLRLTSMKSKWHYLGSYMTYMIGSGNLSVMEHILKELKENNPDLFLARLIEVMIKLEMYEKALEYLESYNPGPLPNYVYILESVCYTKCGSIIQGVKSMNQVEAEGLNTRELNAYYQQMANLASYSKDISKEHEFYHDLIRSWKAKYRDIWLTLKYNETGR